MWRDASISPVAAPQLPRKDSQVWLWLAAAVAAAGCGTCLAVWRRGGRQSSATRPRTDFDGYLKAKAACATAPTAPNSAQRGAAQRSATDFGSFLKGEAATQPSQRRDPTAFKSFLKGSAPREGMLHDGGAGGTPGETRGAPNGSDSTMFPPRPDSVPVTVLFGTEFGFSKEIAEKLRDQLLAVTNYW